MEEKIAVIGTGAGGRNWAMLFAAAGFRVSMYSRREDGVKEAKSKISETMQKFKGEGSLRGSLSVEEQLELISEATSLGDCIIGASYIQECVPEKLEIRREIFRQIDQFITDPNTVIGSSTGAMCPSTFSEGLTHRAQILVVHPVRPPYFLRLVELVPAPWTSASIVERAREIQVKIGQVPVTLKRESPGFALNRLQASVLNECWRLVESDLLSPEDVDRVMTEGLGPRYAFQGPLETIHISAEGIADFCDRYGESIWKFSQSNGPQPKLASDGDVCAKVKADIENRIPLVSLPERRIYRDEKLAQLAKLKFQDGQIN